MTNAFDTSGPSNYITHKTKSDVSRETQAKLHKKPRGKDVPIRGRGPLPGLNTKLPKAMR